VFVGGLGLDFVTGGLGADVFKLTSIEDSLPDMHPGLVLSDRITDFNRNETNEGDVIDLSSVDANPLLPGDQAFQWIASAAFSANATGELRYHNGLLQGSTNADASERFDIWLDGAPTLTVVDFAL